MKISAARPRRPRRVAGEAIGVVALGQPGEGRADLRVTGLVADPEHSNGLSLRSESSSEVSAASSSSSAAATSWPSSTAASFITGTAPDCLAADASAVSISHSALSGSC